MGKGRGGEGEGWRVEGGRETPGKAVRPGAGHTWEHIQTDVAASPQCGRDHADSDTGTLCDATRVSDCHLANPRGRVGAWAPWSGLGSWEPPRLVRADSSTGWSCGEWHGVVTRSSVPHPTGWVWLAAPHPGMLTGIRARQPPSSSGFAFVHRGCPWWTTAVLNLYAMRHIISYSCIWSSSLTTLPHTVAEKHPWQQPWVVNRCCRHARCARIAEP